MKSGFFTRLAWACIATVAIIGSANAQSTGASGLGSTSTVSKTACYGKFPNPVTDICWSCMLPIKMYGQAISTSNQDDVPTATKKDCVCETTGGLPFWGGVMSFYEPVRIAEVVRNPYCFPTLGGTVIDAGMETNRYATRHQQKRSNGRNKTAPRQSMKFYHAHWYLNPVLTAMEVILDHPCLEQGYFDMAFMTEIDPTWSDPEMTGIFNPEILLFTNPISVAACAADCVMATAGYAADKLSLNTALPQTVSLLGSARDAMFWCAGCQGSLYPLNGYVGGPQGHIESSSLIQQRLIAKMHKAMMIKAGWGDSGLCGLYMTPLVRKAAYKSQMMYPVANTDKQDGKCCQPLGQSTAITGAGKTIPIKGEDYSFMIFRKRDCCFPMVGFGTGIIDVSK